MVFDAQHYLVYKLTGAYVQDTSHDLDCTAPSMNLLQHPGGQMYVNILIYPFNILPKVQPPAQISGTVNHKAAEITGLSVGTPGFERNA